MSKFIETKNAKDLIPNKASENFVVTETTMDMDIDSNESPVEEFSRATLEAFGTNVRLTDTDEASGLELFLLYQVWS